MLRQKLNDLEQGKFLNKENPFKELLILAKQLQSSSEFEIKKELSESKSLNIKEYLDIIIKTASSVAHAQVSQDQEESSLLLKDGDKEYLDIILGMDLQGGGHNAKIKDIEELRISFEKNIARLKISMNKVVSVNIVKGKQYFDNEFLHFTLNNLQTFLTVYK